MADELRPDELRDLWGNQPVEPVRLSAEDMRRKALRLEASVRTGLRVIILLSVSAAAGYASFLYFFPSPVHRIGASLTLAAYAFGAYQLYKRGPARKVPDGPVAATCAVYRAELERQRDFCRTAWWRLAAFVPGPVVFIMGFAVPEQGIAKAACLAAMLIVAPFAVGIPINRRAARKFQRDIDALDNLTAPAQPPS